MLYDQFFIDELKSRADIAWRFFVIAVCVVVAVTLAAGRRPAKTVLVDEFVAGSCSHLRGTIDHFLQDLAANPKTVGYVVTAGDENNRIAAVIREERIKAQARVRSFDPSRLRFIRSVQAGVVKTQFWRIPNSTTKMEFPNEDNSYELKAIVGPKLVLKDANFNDSECQDLDYSEIFSWFLRDNPKSRTNIVVYGKEIVDAKRLEKRTIYSLVNRFGIDRKRIRTFLQVVRPDPDSPKAVEYWILP